MSYIRWRMDLAVKQPITKELEAEMIELKERLAHFQAQCVIINEGSMREENTKMMKEHICHHDIGKPCEHEVDIAVIVKEKEEMKQYDTMGKLEALVWIPFKRWVVAGRK